MSETWHWGNERDALAEVINQLSEVGLEVGAVAGVVVDMVVDGVPLALVPQHRVQPVGAVLELRLDARQVLHRRKGHLILT